MKKRILTIATMLLTTVLASGQQACKEPFISEMLEANGQNRALELFNPSDSAIDLSAFSIRVFMNGQLTPLVIPLSGTLPPKSAFVIAHPAAGNDIKAKADMLHPNMNFDGNDAIVLEKTGGTQVDKIGEMGVDPGQSGWVVLPNGSTKDHDLRRKEHIGRGETDWNNGKNQWDVHPKDSVSNLKQHENVCNMLSFPSQTPTTLANGDIIVDDELLVRFNPDYVIAGSVNNQTKTIGLISDFISSTAVNAISAIVGYNIGVLPYYKVHPGLTTADTVSISRTGKPVKLLPYFATVGIILPPGTNDTLAVAQWDTVHPYVESAVLNHLYELHEGANDPEYVNENMASLVATTSIPDANINIEPAWVIEAGASNIRVGVFDSGINYAHEEFGDGTFAGSKVADGFDYFNNSTISSQPNPDSFGHGTAVAGIIGAIRNNSIGVPGIAGGNDSIGNTGVTLYDLKIFQQNDTSCWPHDLGAPANVIQQAIIDGALSSPSGFGLHIMNHSWGGPPNSQVEDAFRTSFENEVVIVAASGNDGIPSPSPCNVGTFPANYKDDWIMKVGANDTTGGRASFSNCGYYLDYIAPGVHELYTSVDNNGNGLTDTLSWGPGGPGCSGFIDGTSFAAPQAAGLSALMLSYVNNHSQKPNNLAPEDCEQLMQRFATDITSPDNDTVGYDDETGYGRINAGATMQNITLPDHQVIHYAFSVAVSNSTLITVDPLDYEGVILNDNYAGLSNGLKTVKRYELTVTNSHTIPANFVVLDGWKRDARSNLPGLISKQGTVDPSVNRIPNEPDVILSSFDSSSATLTGYIYEIVEQDPTTGNWNTLAWYPFDLTDTAEFAYSLYVKDQSLVDIEETQNAEVGGFTIYPNPASNGFTVDVSDKLGKDFSVKVRDIAGRMISQIKFDNRVAGDSRVFVSTESFVPGMYFVSVITSDRIVAKKLVINN